MTQDIIKSRALPVQEALSELNKLSNKLPEVALNTIIDHQQEATPFLLEALNKAITNKESETDNLAFFALFLLAQFQEKSAFPLIMQLLTLPIERADDIAGPDTVTDYPISNIIASVYNGDFDALYDIMKNGDNNEYCRGAAFNSLEALYHTQQISRQALLDCLQKVFINRTFQNNGYLWGCWVCTIMDVYAEPLFDCARAAFSKKWVDEEFVTLKNFESFIIRNHEEAVIADLAGKYGMIDDVIGLLSGWACFNEEEKCSYNNDGLPDTPHFVSNKTLAASTKIGRNSPCPCGSGKKFKKCCL